MKHNEVMALIYTTAFASIWMGVIYYIIIKNVRADIKFQKDLEQRFKYNKEIFENITSKDQLRNAILINRQFFNDYFDNIQKQNDNGMYVALKERYQLDKILLDKIIEIEYGLSNANDSKTISGEIVGNS